jgi:hypothetical protein
MTNFHVMLKLSFGNIMILGVLNIKHKLFSVQFPITAIEKELESLDVRTDFRIKLNKTDLGTQTHINLFLKHFSLILNIVFGINPLILREKESQ